MVVIKEIIKFFKTHWIHALIGIPAIFVFTAFHELAHCVPVWAQGGIVTDFTWLPSAPDMCHINYAVPPENAVGYITQKRLYRDRAISLPTYAALGAIAAVALIAARLI